MSSSNQKAPFDARPPTKKTSATGFFDLPLELRQQIYDETIWSRQDLPSDLDPDSIDYLIARFERAITRDERLRSALLQADPRLAIELQECERGFEAWRWSSLQKLDSIIKEFRSKTTSPKT